MSLTVASAPDSFTTAPRAIIANPISEDFATLRSSLLPALLNIFRLNKHRELPQRIFEIADVVLEARNVRRVATAAMHHKASFTEAKSLVLGLMRDVGQDPDGGAGEGDKVMPGRAAAHRPARPGSARPSHI